jgi:heme exporter protein A
VIDTGASDSILVAEGLSRRFGNRAVVDGIDLALDRGNCLALFGPNGAGKTTLLRMLGGLLRPSSGTAKIAGKALPGGPDIRALVGVISHYTLLYEALTARENVELAARLYHLDNVAERTTNALNRMRMLEHEHTHVRNMSRGMRQRISIARATVHEPSIVLADEPFTGLDESGTTALTGLFRELLGANATMIIVTHNLSEGLALATHAAVMRNGRFARFDRGSFNRDTYAAEYREIVAHD